MTSEYPQDGRSSFVVAMITVLTFNCRIVWCVAFCAWSAAQFSQFYFLQTPIGLGGHNLSGFNSCRARILTPRNDPISFAPTQTGLKNIFKNLALTQNRPNYILPILDRTGPKKFIINMKLTSFRLQQTCEYAMQWSNNIILCARQGL